jgi:hypothetical protein
VPRRLLLAGTHGPRFSPRAGAVIIIAVISVSTHVLPTNGIPKIFYDIPAIRFELKRNKPDILHATHADNF